MEKIKSNVLPELKEWARKQRALRAGPGVAAAAAGVGAGGTLGGASDAFSMADLQLPSRQQSPACQTVDTRPSERIYFYFNITINNLKLKYKIHTTQLQIL